MMSLLLAAAGVAAHDAGYADLAYAKPATEGACEARFDKGAIEITRMFSATRTASVGMMESVMTSSASLEEAIRATAPPERTPWVMTARTSLAN